MIKQYIVSLFAGLSVGLMFCLYFVRDKPITNCYSAGPFKCEVVNNNAIKMIGQTEMTEEWEFIIALEKK